MSEITSISGLIYARAGAEHAAAVAALFDRVGCPCYCRYWDFPGDAREWQNRCANDRPTSRDELTAALAAPTGSANDLLAVVALCAHEDEQRCVGWMRL